MSPDGPKITPPEEKLLRLIRGNRPAPAASQPASQGGHPARPAARPWRLNWSLPAWWLTVVNLVLGCVLVGELALVVMMATRPVPAVPVSIPAAAPMNEAPTPPSSEATPSLSTATRRPLFEPASSPSPAGASAGAQPISADANTLAARLSLIGVVEGDPAQAIIEDAQTKKTFFVSAGQSVIEGLVVEEIRENRVVLDLHGERIELSL